MGEQGNEEEIPFDGDEPFESEEVERERVAEIVARDLVGFQLDQEFVTTCPEPKPVSFVSPSLAELQARYGFPRSGGNPPE
jgi:hypothetical protein